MIYAVHKFSKRHRIVEPDAKGKYRASMDERLVQATPDGWIEWQGGECPLTDGVNHQAKTRDGCKSEIVDTPGCFRWSHWGDYSDIIAYRPILDADTKPEPPAWDGESWPPPIGSIVESFASKDNGAQAEVLAVRQGHVIGCHAESGIAGWLLKEQCRPIRSEEDRVVEEMMEVDEVGFTTRDKAVVLDFARALYHAIRDDKVPGVKLTGGEG